jgi:hypothetical protein
MCELNRATKTWHIVPECAAIQLPDEACSLISLLRVWVSFSNGCCVKLLGILTAWISIRSSCSWFKILHTFSPQTEHTVRRHFIKLWESLTYWLRWQEHFQDEESVCQFCGLELYFLKHLIYGHMCEQAVIKMQKQ